MEIIKEIKNKLANSNSGHKRYYIVKHNGKVCFMKKYLIEYDTSHSKVNLELEFIKSNLIHDILESNGLVNGIRALEYSVEKRYILFEYIENSRTLRDEMLKPSSRFVNDNTFYGIGEALAKIHLGLNARLPFTYDDNIFLYGDYSINNFIIKDNKLYLIDCEPALGNDINHKGKPYNELNMFMYPIENIPLRYKYLDIIRSKHDHEHSFLNGYIDKIGHVFDYRKYLVSKLSVYTNKSKRCNTVRKMLLLRKINIIKHKLSDYIDYREDYKVTSKANSYDNVYNNATNFHTFIWNNIESKKLYDIISKFPYNDKYLDFACGSGRVLKHIGNNFNNPHGIDVSEDMLNIASKTNPSSAKLFNIDITKERNNSMHTKYDIITSFRFFLNANNSLRHESLFNISRLLNDKGIFIFNNHGNKNSFFSLYALYHRIMGREIRTLSYSKISSMLIKFDLEIIATHNYGFVPRMFYLLFGKDNYLCIDRVLSKIPIVRNLGSHQLYVCRNKKFNKSIDCYDRSYSAMDS